MGDESVGIASEAPREVVQDRFGVIPIRCGAQFIYGPAEIRTAILCRTEKVACAVDRQSIGRVLAISGRTPKQVNDAVVPSDAIGRKLKNHPTAILKPGAIVIRRAGNAAVIRRPVQIAFRIGGHRPGWENTLRSVCKGVDCPTGRPGPSQKSQDCGRQGQRPS